MKLLFDVHCAGFYLGSKAEIDRGHIVVCVGQNPELPQEMKDDKIAEYALEKDYIVVTKDVEFVKLCLDKSARVAVLKGNRIFFIEKAVKIIGRDPPRELFSQN
jgi:predicted nuclease of predicted toxin-antitoxin system